MEPDIYLHNICYEIVSGSDPSIFRRDDGSTARKDPITVESVGENSCDTGMRIQNQLRFDDTMNETYSINDQHYSISDVSNILNSTRTDSSDTSILSEQSQTHHPNAQESVYPGVTAFRAAHKKSLIFSYLNVNSLRYKLPEVKPLLTDNLVDILFISETKLDESFPPEQFRIDNFNGPFRKDRNKYGGGLVAYTRGDLPCRRRTDLEKLFHNSIENIIIETHVRKEKWLFIGVYKPPTAKNDHLFQNLENLLNDVRTDFKSIYIIGDMNIDILPGPTKLLSFMDNFGLKNIIEGPTCHKSVVSPSLIDLILTDSPRRVAGYLNIDIGISDFHNLVAGATKMYLPKFTEPSFQYRSMKHFNETHFTHDLSIAPFHVADIFEDPNDSYWFFNQLFSDIVDLHAPVKTARKRPNHAPFMNSELRKARNIKAMLRRRYNKFPNNSNWECYRKQRNLVTKLRKRSINTYFSLKCNINNPRTQFWKAIKPFMSQKSSSQNGCITLYDNDNIINNNQEVCDIFNKHFVSVANDIGQSDPLSENETMADIVHSFENHPSITAIKEQMSRSGKHDFHFVKVNCDYVTDLIKRLNPKKSTGSDALPPRLVRLSSNYISSTITNIVNQSLETGIFPDSLKEAEVSPLFKKDDNMDKRNFRPVSILACISKVFERVYNDQMIAFFEEMLSAFLSAFRKKYSCETVLIKMIEDWKYLLDKHKVIGAMLIDLSKAFDCLPHKLLLAKLNAYGLDDAACSLIRSYLSQRKQRVKLGEGRSSWLNIIKGVPQGSILGPTIFNIFINDIFYKIENIYNYADDNTISRHGIDVHEVKSLLEEGTSAALNWFRVNEMQANPDKFQAIILGNSNTDEISFEIDGHKIKPTNCVKLLGVKIDNKLSFTEHISTICSKAALQLNALGRLSKSLSSDTKYLIFNSFILSNFNYCPLVWHQCSLDSIRKIEKIQERGLRLVLQDKVSSYNDLLQKSKRNFLYVERIKKLALFVYKCVNTCGPPLNHDLYDKKQIHYDLRDPYRLNQPKVNTTTFGLNSLKYSGAALWNQMPIELKQCVELSDFQRLLKIWDGPQCSCGICNQCKIKT